MNVKHVIWATVIIVLATITGAITLEVNGESLDQLMAFFGLVGTPVVTGFLAYIASTASAIKTQTNGNTQTQTDALIKMAHKAAGLEVPNGNPELPAATGSDSGNEAQ